MTTEHLRPFARAAGDAEALWVTGGLYSYVAVGADNANAYTLIDVEGPAGLATPHHLHEREHEGFYVVRGRVTLVLEDRTVPLETGAFAYAPSGVAHAFRLDSEDAKLLLLVTPGAAGHEELFREMGDRAPRHVLPPPGPPPDVARLAEVAGRHGTRVVGPPPGD